MPKLYDLTDKTSSSYKEGNFKRNYDPMRDEELWKNLRTAWKKDDETRQKEQTRLQKLKQKTPEERKREEEEAKKKEQEREIKRQANLKAFEEYQKYQKERDEKQRQEYDKECKVLEQKAHDIVQNHPERIKKYIRNYGSIVGFNSSTQNEFDLAMIIHHILCEQDPKAHNFVRQLRSNGEEEHKCSCGFGYDVTGLGS